MAETVEHYNQRQKNKCPFCHGDFMEEDVPGSFGGYNLTRMKCQGCSANLSNKDYQKWINKPSNK